MEFGEIVTRWTVRAAVACYLACVFLHLATGNRRTDGWARRFWTAGLVLFLIHVAAAFHWFHQGSHLVAYEYNVARTEEITGLRWGGGLYINEAFLVIWLADTVSWWRTSLRPRAWFRTVHTLFAFMMFNSTVVFGPPFWKWIAAAVLPAMGVVWSMRRSPGNAAAKFGVD